MDRDAVVSRAQLGPDGGFFFEAPQPGVLGLRILGTLPAPRVEAANGSSAPTVPRAASHAATRALVARVELGPLVEDASLPPIRLEPRRPVRIVVRARGAVLGGALVAPLDTEPTSRAREAPARTNAAGVAELLLRPDTRELAFAAPGLAPVLVQVPGGEGKVGEMVEIIVELPEGLPATLEVRGPDGRPAAGVPVRVGAAALPIGEADDAGKIALTFPPSSRLPVTIEAENGHFRGELTASDTGSPIRLALEPWTLLSGKVLDDETGLPIADALVWNEDDPGRAVLTDAAGRYAVRRERLDSAISSLRVQARGFRPGAVFRRGGPAPRIEMRTVALEPAWSLTGLVRGRDGRPLAGVSVVAHSGSGPTRATSATRTDGEGWFRVVGLPYGERSALRATLRGHSTEYRELAPPPRREAGREIEIEMTPAPRLAGRVLDPDGSPLEDAEIVVLHSDPGIRGLSPHLFGMRGLYRPERARTGADGRFAIESAPAPIVNLGVHADGVGALSVAELDLSQLDELDGPSAATTDPARTTDGGAGLTLDLGDLVVERGTTRRGRVVDEEGRGLSGVELTLGSSEWQRRNGFGFEQSKVSAAADGSFVLPGLPDHHLSLFASKAGYLSESVDVRPPHDVPLRVVMQEARSVRGRVVWRSGAAAPHALLRWFATTRQDTERSDAESVADAAGFFELTGIPPGKASIWAVADGAQPTKVEVDLTSGDPPQPVELMLDPAATLVGTVRGSGGAPVSDAAVQVVYVVGPDGRRPRFDRSRWQVAPTRRGTDAEGRFAIDGLEPGPVEIHARHDEHLELERPAVLELGENAIDLELEAGLEIRGWVRDERGEPVAGASVWKMPQMPAAAGTVISRGGSGGPLTASDGSFTLSGLAPGIYTVSAERMDGANGSTRPLQLVDRSIAGVEIVVPDAVSIEGVVEGLTAEEARSVVVRAMKDGDFASRTSWIDDADETDFRFRIDGLGPGTWRVSAMSERGTVSETVVIEPGMEPPEVTLRFDRGEHSLRGVVLADGEPVAGASISWWSAVSTELRGNGTTDGAGRFEVDGLHEGEITLSARWEQAGASRTVEIFGDVDVALELDRAELVVAVRDDLNGAPVEGARLELRRPLSETAWLSFSAALTDGEGRATVAGHPGTFDLVIHHDGFVDRTIERVELRSDGTSPLEVTLERGRELAVRVLDERGSPLAAGAAQVKALGDDGSQLGAAPTVQEGIARLSVLWGKVAWIEVEAAGFASSTRAVAGGDAAVDVQLSRGGRVRVSAPELFSSGEPAYLSASAPAPWRKGRNRRLQLGRWMMVDGEGVAEALPAGEVRLDVQVVGTQTRYSATAWVIEGETVSVTARRVRVDEQP